MTKETRSQFRERAALAVGIPFAAIPVAPRADLVGTYIAARRGGVIVAWVGYPTHVENGTPFFAPSQARVFRL